MTSFFGKMKQKKKSFGQMLSMQQFEKEAMQKRKDVAPDGYVAIKFDIDRFAELKSRYGSQRGEQLLDELVAALANDRTHEYLFTQLQGDQFLLLSENTSDFMVTLQAELASAVAELRLEQYVGAIQFSFGVYELFGAEETLQDIIDKVSIAHKTAAKSPHKTVVYYDTTLMQTIAQENYYNEHLLEGIAKGEFKIYLQQQVSFALQTPLRAKALVRWSLPNGRLIYPDSFIPQFEKNGMMVHLDFYVMEQVCQYLAMLRNTNAPEMVVSVSVSPISLFQPDFMLRFTALIASYEVHPSQFVLEIQQAVLIDGESKVLQMLTDLKEQGFILAADPVNTGYSNLRLLAELPVQFLKIDRKFIRAADTNEKIKYIIASIIDMAHQLSMQVVCEGIEHQADVLLLRSLGCDIAQGYYLMKAVPKEDFLYVLDGNAAALQRKLKAE